MTNDNRLFTGKLIDQLKVPLGFVAVMWIAFVVDILSLHSLRGLGIFPRTFEGLLGIITAPFIHGDFQHLLSNTFPMLFLLSMLFLLYKDIARQVFISLYILTGLMVWLFARPSYHIGASGIVYALVSYLFWTGIFRRNVRSIAISLVILFLYSSYFMGILPDDPGISWESHLMGGLMGIVVAYLFKNSIPNDRDEDDSFPDEIRHPYFKEDAFLLTKRERQLLRDGNWSSDSSL